jgi:ADP-ribosylglycohydrolase
MDSDGLGQNYVAGMFTDDCEMTLGLMHALMDAERSGPSKDDMVASWVAEYRKAPDRYLLSWMWKLVDVGRNGHGGFQNVMKGDPTEAQITARVEDMRRWVAASTYPGNAPPMRALPLAFIADDTELVRLAFANADSTHPHSKARLSSLGVALAGRYFMIDRREPAGIIPFVIEQSKLLASRDGSVGDLETWEYLASVEKLPKPGPMDTAYESFVSDADLETLCGQQPVWQAPQRPRTVRGLNADAMRTLGCVLWLLKHHDTGKPMQSLMRSLCIGGDVDSLAALVLGMVGGREGLRIGEASGDGLPLFMLQQLEAAEYIVETASKFGAWVDATQSQLAEQPAQA